MSFDLDQTVDDLRAIGLTDDEVNDWLVNGFGAAFVRIPRDDGGSDFVALPDGGESTTSTVDGREISREAVSGGLWHSRRPHASSHPPPAGGNGTPGSAPPAPGTPTARATARCPLHVELGLWRPSLRRRPSTSPAKSGFSSFPLRAGSGTVAVRLVFRPEPVECPSCHNHAPLRPACRLCLGVGTVSRYVRTLYKKGVARERHQRQRQPRRHGQRRPRRRLRRTGHEPVPGCGDVGGGEWVAFCDQLGGWYCVRCFVAETQPPREPDEEPAAEKEPSVADWLDGAPMDPCAVSPEPLAALAGFPFLHAGASAVIPGPTGGGRSMVAQACAYDAARGGLRSVPLGSEVTKAELNARAAIIAEKRGDDPAEVQAELARVRYLDLTDTLTSARRDPATWSRARPTATTSSSSTRSTTPWRSPLRTGEQNRDYVRFYREFVGPLTDRGVAVVMLDDIGHAQDAADRAMGASAKGHKAHLTFHCTAETDPLALRLKVTKVRSVRAPFKRGDQWECPESTLEVRSLGVFEAAAPAARPIADVLVEQLLKLADRVHDEGGWSTLEARQGCRAGEFGPRVAGCVGQARHRPRLDRNRVDPEPPVWPLRFFSSTARGFGRGCGQQNPIDTGDSGDSDSLVTIRFPRG